MRDKKVTFIVQAAVIAALYVAVSYTHLTLPTSA